MTHKKIMILGGGQLARMMAMEAFKLGWTPYILSNSHEDPAAQVSLEWVHWDGQDPEPLKYVASLVDHIFFESEFIDPDLIKDILGEEQNKCSPSLELMKEFRDRQTQKQSFLDHDLPSSKLHNTEASVLKSLIEQNKKLVLKKRLFGYDGYGTFFLNSQDDLDSIKESLDSYICEEHIAFTHELAVTYFCFQSQISRLPLVETHQRDSRCLWVKGPSSFENLESFKDLDTKLRAFLKTKKYHGAITFELFLTSDSKLLINELAPRVHNSAHYSLDALPLNQFKAHILCHENFNTPETLSCAEDFAMVNLLGTGESPQNINSFSDTHLHWYAKSENRKGRKMGHLTLLGDDQEKCLELGLKLIGEPIS